MRFGRKMRCKEMQKNAKKYMQKMRLQPNFPGEGKCKKMRSHIFPALSDKDNSELDIDCRLHGRRKT